MAMNFWEAQRRCRSRTTLYLTVFIILTLIIAVLAETAMRYFAGDSYTTQYPLVGLAFLAITFIVAVFEYSMYTAYGGGYVAESMGARRLGRDTPNPQEKQLLNIVEEMALAASLPLPRVYVLDAGEINAFAAGIAPDRSAITVTRGSLDSLSRDELQGVVAHEFGHIYNGDAKISMRLAAMVMGFFFVLYIALRLFQFSGFMGGGSRNGNGEKKGQILLL